MKKPLLILSALALSAVSASAAHAAVCVSLDQTRDNLTEQERGATIAMLQQTLRDQGQDVQNQNCADTFYVYHLRLGSSVTVYLQSQRGYRSSTARAIEELPAVYSQMVRSLMTGQPMSATNNVVDRNNVTMAQQAPRRVEADSLWYVKLGYGGVAGPAFVAGPALGFGYRYELDNIAVYVSFFNLMFSSGDTQTDANGVSRTSSGGVSGSWAKLAALWYKDPIANSSIYLGGGLSWGGAVVASASSTSLDAYSGSGLQAEAIAGFEFLRASSIRLFAEADATIPFYRITRYDSVSGTEKGYAPMFTVGVGIGWGRSNIRVQMVQ